jgi:hypothetical protein
VTNGGPQTWRGSCWTRTRTGSIAIGGYSELAQTVEVTLEQPRKMAYGRRKSLEFFLIFFAMLGAALLWFCFCVLPGPKYKQD